jgi:hypothetical protein
MLTLAENALIVGVVALIDAAIFALSPILGIAAVLVTGPLTLAILAQ